MYDSSVYIDNFYIDNGYIPCQDLGPDKLYSTLRSIGHRFVLWFGGNVVHFKFIPWASAVASPHVGLSRCFMCSYHRVLLIVGLE